MHGKLVLVVGAAAGVVSGAVAVVLGRSAIVKDRVVDLTRRLAR